jgi:hypothetical protein
MTRSYSVGGTEDLLRRARGGAQTAIDEVREGRDQVLLAMARTYEAKGCQWEQPQVEGFLVCFPGHAGLVDTVDALLRLLETLKLLSVQRDYNAVRRFLAQFLALAAFTTATGAVTLKNPRAVHEDIRRRIREWPAKLEREGLTCPFDDY